MCVCVCVCVLTYFPVTKYKLDLSNKKIDMCSY